MADKISALLLEKWDSKDFEAYVLMYAAYADNQLKDEEFQAIVDHVGNEKAEFSKKLIEKLNKTERTEMLLRFKPKFFATEAEAAKILDEMQEIFEADGRFCIMEQSALLFLRSVML